MFHCARVKNNERIKKELITSSGAILMRDSTLVMRSGVQILASARGSRDSRQTKHRKTPLRVGLALSMAWATVASSVSHYVSRILDILVEMKLTNPKP